MKEIGDIVRVFRQHPEQPLALATLVRTWGSSYRKTGARMLITSDGKTAGSLSGGCLEEEVVETARQVALTGFPTLMTFDTKRRFGCNGGLEILVEKPLPEFLEGLTHSYETRQPCVISTKFTGEMGSRIVTTCADVVVETEMLQRIEPALQVLVIGDGPDTMPLCRLCETLGWNFRLLECASEIEGHYDSWTAAIVKTHNYGRDFAALRTLLALDLRYVGLMGPRARREQLLGDLLDTGVAPGPNLYAPAGLDLGQGSPEAIALSIVAEIQAVFRHGTGESLRERKSPIHAHALSLPILET